MATTFADTLSTSANIGNLVTNQQTLLIAAIVIPFGFVAYKLIRKVLNRVG
jgi:EamA domain-containing membrane protein RarD